jgi:hypothetical protein
VHGPQALTVLEALQSYCRALHPEINTFGQIPYWLLRVMAWIRRDELLRRGVEMIAYLEKVGERGDPSEANAILGAPQITLNQWLEMQKTALRNSRR